MNVMRIGSRDEFRTKSCYKLYLYAVKLANQVNEYIDKGFLVLSDGEPVNRFVFYGHSNPCVGEGSDRCIVSWVGNTFDDNGKVWLHGDVTKTDIKKMFKNILIYNPKDSIKLKV